MYRKLSIPVGVAMLAALALVGMLGIFAFNASQPAQAAGVSNLMVSVSNSAPGATANYTFRFTATEQLEQNQTFININAPMGYTVVDGGTANATVNGTSVTANTSDKAASPRLYAMQVPVQINSGAMATVVLMGVMNPATAGDYDWMVDTNVGSPAMMSATVMIVGDGGTMPDPMMPTSVTAQPDDPGDGTQLTIKFNNPTALMPDESITFTVSDDLGVPGSINRDHVSVSGMSDGRAVSAAPRSAIVESDNQAEVYEITIFLADMDTSEASRGPDGLDMGMATVIFRQSAGITNRTEGGSDDWTVFTSEAMDPVDIANVYLVPRTITLSTYGDPRGEEVTVIGKGFKNGTTTKFWIDKNQDGKIDSNAPKDEDNEEELCNAIANGDDIAECKFTLTNPPFDPGKARNYINASDGRSQEVTDPDGLPRIELEPSLSVTPNQGNPGDSINYQLKDFTPGHMVRRIQFARLY